MKIYLTLLLSLVAFASGEDIKEEEDVLVLTEAVFDQAIADNEHILVEFCKLLHTFWFLRSLYTLTSYGFCYNLWIDFPF